MSPVRPGRASAPAVTSERLGSASDALNRAVELAGDAFPPDEVAQAEALAHRVGERSRISGDHTVVALAGATGSGKSSLFNAIVGAPVSRIGATRPTTSTATAAVWGQDSASELLDWLQISARHHVSELGGIDQAQPDTADAAHHVGGAADLSGVVGSLNGLVLLDLPDFDSREPAHRREAERVLALADVFVWVTDPQKYADARMHDEFVGLRSHHDAVTIVVLNQVDRLAHQVVQDCRRDLVRLLEADGLATPVVLTTSVTTGSGIPELVQRLANTVAGQAASRTRLFGDVRASAARLRRLVGDAEVSAQALPRQDLDAALAGAAGVPTVLEAVARDYRREAFSHTGWLFARWTRGFSADPLRRLRLDRTGGRPAIEVDVEPGEVRAVLGRSSIPAPTAATRARVQAASRAYAKVASDGLPYPWAVQVDDAVAADERALADDLDQAILTSDLRARAPLWWHVLNGAQWTLGLVAVIGLLWTLGVFAMQALGFVRPDPPSVGILPLPFVLMVGAIVVGLFLGLAARWWAKVGARARKAKIARRLHAAVAAVTDEHVVTPVQGVLDRHRRTREALDSALS